MLFLFLASIIVAVRVQTRRATDGSVCADTAALKSTDCAGGQAKEVDLPAEMRSEPGHLQGSLAEMMPKHKLWEEFFATAGGRFEQPFWIADEYEPRSIPEVHPSVSTIRGTSVGLGLGFNSYAQAGFFINHQDAPPPGFGARSATFGMNVVRIPSENPANHPGYVLQPTWDKYDEAEPLYVPRVGDHVVASFKPTAAKNRTQVKMWFGTVQTVVAHPCSPEIQEPRILAVPVQKSVHLGDNASLKGHYVKPTRSNCYLCVKVESHIAHKLGGNNYVELQSRKGIAQKITQRHVDALLEFKMALFRNKETCSGPTSGGQGMELNAEGVSMYRAKEAELKNRFDAELGEELGTYEEIVEETVPYWLPILRPEGAAPEHQNPLNFDSGLLVVEYMCGYDRNDDTKGLHAIMKDRTGGMSSKATRGIALYLRGNE